MTTHEQLSPVPWSEEAEQAVLGCVLLTCATLDHLTEHGLTSSHFFDPRHRDIWCAINDLSARSRPVDVLTVFEHLRDSGLDERCGGIGYLSALVNSIGNARNAGHYARIVIDKAMRRAIVEASGMAIDLAHAPGDADEALDKAATLFAAIKRQRGGNAPQRLGDLVRARFDRWTSLATGEIQPGIPTGLRTLDEALGGGLKPGTLIVLGARPSIGKTSLAGQIAMTVAQQGHTVLMLSQEMRAGDLADRFVANLASVHLDHLIAGALTNDDWAALPAATDKAAGLPLFVDDQPALSLLDIRAKARQVQKRDGLALVIVDYLQLCSSAIAFDKRHHQIEQISRGMKTLAKELGVCVLLLSQLKRDNGEPELDHLKESGAIEEDADTVILLHPMGHEADGSMLILAKVPKNRQGRRGRLGLSFDGRTQHWKGSAGNVSRGGITT